MPAGWGLQVAAAAVAQKCVPWGLAEGGGVNKVVWCLLGGVAEGQRFYDGEQRAGHAQQRGHAKKADKSSLLSAEGRLR